MSISKEFGGKPSKAEKEFYAEHSNYKDGKFYNLIPTNMDMSLKSMYSTIKDFIKGVPNGKPKEAPKVLKPEMQDFYQSHQIMWFGHSAFLMNLGKHTILLDPMLGNVPAPHPWLGGNRFQKELPVEIEQLEEIDVVLISHDHYDHLDYKSILKLKDKCKQFLVPLGVGPHLRRWGIDTSRIKEFYWWDEYSIDGLELAFTPSRHFSGRGLNDNSSTLWGSWVIKSDSINLYFSGDSGYGPHFKSIGDKYGPFDFAMMECGQYNEKWAAIHMMPEETAKASKDIRTKVAMPIHWGSFQLALHSWTDPVERVTKSFKELNQEFIIPQIGEVLDLNNPKVQNSFWWK